MSRGRHNTALAYGAGGVQAIAADRRRSPRRRPQRSGLTLDLGIVLFTALAIVATLTLSSSLLTHLNINYVTAGGSFYEKLHPATYLVILALGLSLLRARNPIHELVRLCAGSTTILFYLVCWVFLLAQTVVLDRPFTAVVDTFLLPLLIALAVWQTPPSSRRVLAGVFHLCMVVNVAIGYYEYFSGDRIIPLTLGNIVVYGEWRSAALLGHPLTASGLVAGYVLALVLKPQLCPHPLLRVPLILFCLGSLMVFGGRTALVTTLLIIALCFLFELVRVLRGRRIPLAMLIAGVALTFAGAMALLAILDLGVFDKMLLRFSSDKGSALARLATLDLVSHLDWNEILFGPTTSRANALQSELGLDYGIENFWIASIVQFGLIHTVLMTVALAAFFTMLLRRSSGAALALVILITVIAASSVSFSSKNIQLAQFIILIVVLLPRNRAPRAAPAPRSYGTSPPVHARPARAGSML